MFSIGGISLKAAVVKNSCRASSPLPRHLDICAPMLPNSPANMRAFPESGGAVSGAHEMPEGRLERSRLLLDLQIARPLPLTGQPHLAMMMPLRWQRYWCSR